MSAADTILIVGILLALTIGLVGVGIVAAIDRLASKDPTQ